MMQSANVILDEEPLPSPPPNTNMSPLFENVKHTHMAVPISEHSDSSHSPYIKQYECIREWAPKTYLEKGCFFISKIVTIIFKMIFNDNDIIRCNLVFLKIFFLNNGYFFHF